MTDEQQLIDAIETAKGFANRAWATLISHNTEAETELTRLREENARLRETITAARASLPSDWDQNLDGAWSQCIAILDEALGEPS